MADEQTQTTCTYCIRRGFAELDGMCHHHYRWLVCNSLRYGADRAEQEWAAAIDRVYRVEVQLGLRPSPYEPNIGAERQSAGDVKTASHKEMRRAIHDDSDEDFI